MTTTETTVLLRPLSSGATFFLKFLMSPLFILQVLQTTMNMAAHHYALNVASWTEHNWLWVILAIISFMFSHKIKRVRLDDKNKNLHVSNYVKEIVIPFSEVKEVTRAKLPRNLITLHLSDNTAFGRQILFAPLWSGGQFINELKERIGLEE